MAKALFAGFLALLIVGVSGVALANAREDHAAPQPGVVTLFGKTLCTPQAPAATDCDWRIPARAAPRSETAAPASRFTLFGKTFCFDGAPAGQCDFDLSPHRTARADEGEVLHVLGMTWCFGGARPASGCDLKLPAVADSGGRRLSLR